MFQGIRKQTAWMLIAALAIISGVGEGLHLMPGCGHGSPCGNGYVLLGISLPDDQLPGDDRPGVDIPNDFKIPFYDEDQCEICSFIAQQATRTATVQFILVMPLAYELPAVAALDAPATEQCCFQARAPPLV